MEHGSEGTRLLLPFEPPQPSDARAHVLFHEVEHGAFCLDRNEAGPEVPPVDPLGWERLGEQKVETVECRDNRLRRLTRIAHAAASARGCC